MLKKWFVLALCALLACPCALAGHSRDEVRGAYHAITGTGDASPYAQAPSLEAPYDAGALTDAARADALGYLNFCRWLADLDPVAESGIYDYQCQHGAALLAALDYVDHDAPKPLDMDQNFYDSAHTATSSGNIARFNWMRPSILREGVAYFLRDDGEDNLLTLGHRRWALNPLMNATGFGLANSRSGMSYVLMYAHDLGRPDAPWDSVCWPAAGAFPAELMHEHLAWSVTLNPAAYDLAASLPQVTLSEPQLGLSFHFSPATGTGDGDCAASFEGYGAGPCLSFRPDFIGTEFTDYQQNQRWTVRVDGLVASDGSPAPLEYEVEMISLHVEDVANVEITPLEAALEKGDVLQMRADIVPAYADDLRVFWRSSDEAIATVDEDGLVTAFGPGVCDIVASSANGREDSCRVNVR